MSNADVKDFMGMGDEAPSVEESKFVVLPAAYERTTSFRKGTVMGPKEFLRASAQVEFYDEELLKETCKEIPIATLPTFAPKAKETAAAYMGRLSSAIEKLVAKGKCVVTVGGEHTLTYAPVAAYAKHVKDLSILHFDAHADLRVSYEDNHWSHACALRRSIEAVEREGGTCKVAMVGIRSLDIDEARFVDANPNVRMYDHLRHRDPHVLAQQVINHLGPNVYVTIDLDGFDPAVIPGVGTPQPGGFGWYDTLDLMREVFAKKNIVGFDLMELSPIKGEVMSELAAAKLAYRLIGYASQKSLSLKSSGVRGLSVAK